MSKKPEMWGGTEESRKAIESMLFMGGRVPPADMPRPPFGWEEGENLDPGFAISESTSRAHSNIDGILQDNMEAAHGERLAREGTIGPAPLEVIGGYPGQELGILNPLEWMSGIGAAGRVGKAFLTGGQSIKRGLSSAGKLMKSPKEIAPKLISQIEKYEELLKMMNKKIPGFAQPGEFSSFIRSQLKKMQQKLGRRAPKTPDQKLKAYFDDLEKGMAEAKWAKSEGFIPAVPKSPWGSKIPAGETLKSAIEWENKLGAAGIRAGKALDKHGIRHKTEVVDPITNLLDLLKRN